MPPVPSTAFDGDEYRDEQLPPFNFLWSFNSSYELVPGQQTRRWRPQARQRKKATRSYSPRRSRSIATIIALVCLTLVLVLGHFARASKYRLDLAMASFRRVAQLSTLAFDGDELRRIWEWEILSGHYPTKKHSEHFQCALIRY